jgi:hypothetical protein
MPDGKTPAPSRRSSVTASLPAPIRGLTGSAVVQVAAKAAVLRALELVGARMTTRGDRKGHLATVAPHEVHAHIGPVDSDRAQRLLDGVWTHLPSLAADVCVSVDRLEAALHVYCYGLLTTARAHRDEDLARVLEVLS